MVFSSLTFIYYFLPIVLILYFVVPKKFRNICLLICSICFYIYGDISYLWVLILSCTFNFISGLLMDKFKDKKKLIFILTVIFDLGLLIYFKYTNFLIDNINLVLGSNIRFYKILLPLGISFYTFQNLSYVIDVYKGRVLVNKNFINYATYIFLFPQLIAGPIVRYKDIDDELNKRCCSVELFGSGVSKFIIGLSKKVLIANCLGDAIAALYGISVSSWLSYFLIALFYALQLYFDFSGYSDMAIGLGRMFGFHFQENFNYPFIASSITDFWRRWHISLSSFFKDYVYIPLGGNRCGKLRQLFNILVVWSLTGFWHGANWNFLLWGLLFFMMLILEKFFLKSFLEKHKIFSHIYTLFIVVISFVVFSITDMRQMGIFFKNLFGFGGISFVNKETLYYFKSYFVILVVAIICSCPIFKIIKEKYKNKFIDVLSVVLCFILLILVTGSLVDSSFNPFLYFRF